MVRGHRVVDRLYDESNITSDAARVDTLVVASCVGIVLLLVGFIVSKIWRLREREKIIRSVLCIFLLFLYVLLSSQVIIRV